MGRVNYHESIQVARKVLVAFNEINDLPAKFTKQLYFEAFTNCREQGYCIKGYALNLDSDSNTRTVPVLICIARNRNSDSIVVYNADVGFINQHPGNMLSNTPDWDNSKLFKPRDFDGAARYCIGLLKDVSKAIGMDT